MSRSWSLLCLFKKGEVHSSLSKLFDIDYVSHIGDWSYHLPENTTLVDIVDILKRIDALPHYSFQEAMHSFYQGNEDVDHFRWTPIRFGDSQGFYDYKYDPSRAVTREKYFEFNLEPILYLGLDDMVAFEIIFPTSTHSRCQTSRGTWLMLQPVLEVIQPYYCFSTAFPDHLDDYLYNEDEAFLTQPWQYFWNTVVYNLSFVDTLGLSQAFQVLKENDEVYYYKELDNLIWISSPWGMGNENPGSYVVDYRNVNYFDDSAISNFASQWVDKHYRNMVTRLKLLSPSR